MGFGRLVQRHHDLPGYHGDRSRPGAIAVVTFADNPKSDPWQATATRRRRCAVRLVRGVVFLCDDRMPPHGRARHAARGVGRGGCGRPARWSAESERAVAQPLALDEYMDMPPMVAPFCRDDCTLVSDGAAAVVVMSTERARKMGVPSPVPVLGFGLARRRGTMMQRPDMIPRRRKSPAKTRSTRQA